MNKLFYASMTVLLAAISALPLLAQTHEGHKAVAVVYTTSAWEGSERVLGEVYFEEKGEGLLITGHLKGLEPNSVHGFHVHQYGDMTKADGTSAGGHFNPHDKPHASPEAENHHAGDLGNIKADENGEVKLNIKADWLRIDEGEHAILGRAVVVHDGADDLKSQPSGDAGARIGVGIVGWANTEAKKKKK